MKGVIRYSGARPLWAHTRNVQSQSGAGAYSQMQTLVLCDLKLRWQMTQFSMGATVSANKTSQTPAAISWSHETSSFFFCLLIYHNSWLKQYFSRIGNVKNLGEIFSPGKPRLEASYSQIAAVLTFSPRIREDTLFSTKWHLKTVHSKGGGVFNIACHPWKL